MRKAVGLSLEALSSLIADIHEAGVSGDGWLDVVRQIGRLLNSQSTTLFTQDASERFDNVESVLDPWWVCRYAEYYGRLDTLRPAVMRAPAGSVVTDEMVVAHSDFVRTEFYNDFARPSDMRYAMMAHLFGGPDSGGCVAVTRPERAGAFEHHDMRLLSLLAPHLCRAMQTRLRLGPSGIGADSALEALDRLSGGALIVDAEARVAHANRAGEATLAKADGLGTERDSGARRLRAATPEQTRALRRLIWQAAMSRHDASLDAGGVLRLASEAGASLLASVSPLRAGLAWNAARRPAALVLLSAPDEADAPAPGHLHALFGLTPTEAAVAGRIMRGDGVKAAARALGIAPNTVRTHLSRIFEKTETHRQAELVRLLQQVARLGEP